MIKLGDLVKDKLTTFQGRVIACTKYLTSASTILVQPVLEKHNVFIDATWFEESRLTLLKEDDQDDRETDTRGNAKVV